MKICWYFVLKRNRALKSSFSFEVLKFLECYLKKSLHKMFTKKNYEKMKRFSATKKILYNFLVIKLLRNKFSHCNWPVRIIVIHLAKSHLYLMELAIT